MYNFHSINNTLAIILIDIDTLLLQDCIIFVLIVTVRDGLYASITTISNKNNYFYARNALDIFFFVLVEFNIIAAYELRPDNI